MRRNKRSELHVGERIAGNLHQVSRRDLLPDYIHHHHILPRGSETIAYEIHRQRERFMPAIYQHGGLYFFREILQEGLESIQHSTAGVGHIIYQHDHFIGKIDLVGNFHGAGLQLIQLHFYDLCFKRSDPFQMCSDLLREDGTPVPNARQYDGRLVVIVFVYFIRNPFYLLFNGILRENNVLIFHVLILCSVKIHKLRTTSGQIKDMEIVYQLLFLVALGAASWLFTRRILAIRQNILRGRDVELDDQPAARWKNVLLLAFGQKKMFRNPLVAVLHFFVYAGFIIINLEILEIMIDGIAGTHRIFAPFLGSLYVVLIGCFEILAVLVAVSCAIFLVRRNIIKLKRFISKDLDGWPRSDANYILFTEIILMLLFLTMNTADQALQARGVGHYIATGDFWVTSHFASLLSGFSDHALIALERCAWWLHILGILAFLNYLPFSKHLHIILAFPNAYYADLRPKGKMENMPAIQQEVLYAMQPELAANAPVSDTVPKFGAKDIQDLTWKNLLDAYACTECGRCSAACPATQTGKALSPRLIMMKTRDRAEEVGRLTAPDAKTLLRDYITEEELRACTTCNACVMECPVSINPLHIILQMRRHLIMEESSAPQEWNMMFSNIENNMAPWKFSPDDRDAWVQ